MNQPNDPLEDYVKKFSDFIEMCEKAKQDNIPQVIIHHPSVLGDTYEEVIESLSRLADAELSLYITSR
jgi:hypothetical protein